MFREALSCDVVYRLHSTTVLAIQPSIRVKEWRNSSLETTKGFRFCWTTPMV